VATSVSGFHLRACCHVNAGEWLLLPDKHRGATKGQKRAFALQISHFRKSLAVLLRLSSRP